MWAVRDTISSGVPAVTRSALASSPTGIRARTPYDGAIVPDPEGIITSGHQNKTARCIAVYRDQRINVPALTTMLRHIADNNRAGGWRKLKAQQ